ncbi:MAG: TIGR00299 family protein [Puniceicoccaceae bacterium MED-G31]|nr:MAG: TIGR00299 family protein [Puniceicoccaceae bacterium MED-G31]
MATLLYQCPAGISGDMNLAALVALGVDPSELESELRKLPYSGWSLEFKQDNRHGIHGLNCTVIVDEESSHTHESSESDHHKHRTYREIREAIEQSEIAKAAKSDAIACFKALAEAEAAVHGVEPDKVHFHEVGAIDSIIDIVGSAIGWHLLGVERVVCSSLEVGGGTVRCAHGVMPVPAPATSRLLNAVPFSSGATDKETTTPTGAALLIGKGCEFGQSISGIQIRAAIAIGQREDPNIANALYVSLIDEGSKSNFDVDQVWEVVTNIDDMTAESLSFTCEQLFHSGALDVWQTPATFKKGRLGCSLHALATDTNLSNVENCLLKYSRTLGLRKQKWSRTKLPRELSNVATPWGDVRVKTATLPDSSTRYKFDFDDCATIANSENQTLAWVEEKVQELYLKQTTK